MKSIAFAVALMLLLFAVPVHSQTVTASQKAEIEKAVKEQMTKWYAAWDSLSAEAAKQVWSREKMIGSLRATGLLSDLEAISSGYKTTMENRKSNKVEISEILVYPFSPETALGISRGVWRVELKNGNITNYNFADTMIWVKEPGGWKLVHEAQRTAAQATDPLIGTWELNVPKSTFNPGPSLESSTRKFEAAGDGLKFSGQNVNADGTKTVGQWTAYFDGKDYPVTGDPNADTMSLKRIDRFNTEGTAKKGGKVTYRVQRVVSQDGRVWTLTLQGTDPQGKPYTNVLVFDKK
jgi:ketosteroid isomerase-like protein